MKKALVLIFFISVLSGGLFAQYDDENSSVIISDAKIDSLLDLHLEYNKKYPVFQGYRIQILKASGNEALEIIEESKADFSEKYNDVPVYLTFDEPDYRVRVGDFRTRLEAEKFLKKISRKYPGAWVIQDDINFPVLPKYYKNQKL
ncbi:MAG: SPOR domain-containing protein [Bacteroidota bacterium]